MMWPRAASGYRGSRHDAKWRRLVLCVNISFVLQEGGMLATHRHESILGGSRVEHMLSHAAEHRVAALDQEQNVVPAPPAARRSAAPPAATRSAAPSGEASQPSSSVVALLAVWKGVAIEHMAETLLGMTAAERSQLREQYARQ